MPFSEPSSFNLSNTYHPDSFHQSSSGPSSSTSGSPKNMDFPRSTSPVDARTKNARAQARHRAKRKAYIENLENTVRQLRAAVSQGLSPQAQAQAQVLERENARLRAEAQYLRAQLNSLGEPATGPLSSSWVPAPSQNANSSMRLPSALGLSASSSSSPSHSSMSDYQRLRSALSAENLRSGHSPESRRDRAAASAPYSVDPMRRNSYRPQDYQYTLQTVDATAGSTSAAASLLSSPYQQSGSSSSSTVADLYEQNYAAYSYSGASTSSTQQAPTSTVYSNAPIAAPQSSYPPLSSYTASLYGLSEPQYTGSQEDIKPVIDQSQN